MNNYYYLQKINYYKNNLKNINSNKLNYDYINKINKYIYKYNQSISGGLYSIPNLTDDIINQLKDINNINKFENLLNNFNNNISFSINNIIIESISKLNIKYFFLINDYITKNNKDNSIDNKDNSIDNKINYIDRNKIKFAPIIKNKPINNKLINEIVKYENNQDNKEKKNNEIDIPLDLEIINKLDIPLDLEIINKLEIKNDDLLEGGNNKVCNISKSKNVVITINNNHYDLNEILNFNNFQSCNIQYGGDYNIKDNIHIIYIKIIFFIMKYYDSIKYFDKSLMIQFISFINFLIILFKYYINNKKIILDDNDNDLIMDDKLKNKIFNKIDNTKNNKKNYLLIYNKLDIKNKIKKHNNSFFRILDKNKIDNDNDKNKIDNDNKYIDFIVNEIEKQIKKFIEKKNNNKDNNNNNNNYQKLLISFINNDNKLTESNEIIDIVYEIGINLTKNNFKIIKNKDIIIYSIFAICFIFILSIKTIQTISTIGTKDILDLIKNIFDGSFFDNFKLLYEIISSYIGDKVIKLNENNLNNLKLDINKAIFLKDIYIIESFIKNK